MLERRSEKAENRSMPYDSSPRQAVLQQLWNSTGKDDVWDIMSREPAARVADIAPELLSEAEDCRLVNPNLAGRLEEIAEEVARVNTSVDRFAAITGMADLLELYKSYEFSWLGKFNRILGGCHADALRSGDQQRVQGLRNAFKVLQSVYVAIGEATKPEGKGEETWTRTLQSSPLLCDPHFHEFLDRRANFAAQHNDPSAEAFAKVADFLRFCCKTVRAITKLEEHQFGADGTDGHVEISLPLKPEQAELWFAICEEFIATASELAKKVNEATVTLQNAIATITQFQLSGGKEFGRPDKEDEKRKETFFSSAFLEHLLLVASPENRLDALILYRDLVTTGYWSSQESRATFLLRYAKAVLVHWRYFPEPLIRLHEAINLMAETLPSVDVTKSPRLTRDLWFVRARILENIGIWEPESYEAAAISYQRGLDVPNIAFELEARGMALTDYANTLSRLHPADEEAHDMKIIATFREALTIFKTEKRILGGTLALNSYAIYLNERRFGEVAENQERALALAQEAIDLIEADEAKFDEGNDHLRRTVAGAYLTKSNIILQREVVDDCSAHEAAINALHSAWDKLGGSQDDQLRGIIKFNLGHAYIALYAMTGDASRARDAMYAYQEAEGLLQAYPLEYSQALLGTAMLVSEVPECCSPEELQKSLASGEEALAILEKANVPTAMARAWACLAELRLLRAHVGDDEAAIDYLTLARDNFFAAGSVENAITAARRIAAVHIRVFRKAGSLDGARAAKDVLLTAAKWVDELWEQIDSVDWHYLISDRYSDVYADIAWCQSVLGDPLEEIVFMAARAKGREFLTHSRELQFGAKVSENLAEYADQLRVDSRFAERKRWQASRKAKPDIALDQVMRDSREEMRQAELRRRLLFPRPAEGESISALTAVEAFLKTHPKSIILDITLSRWGTVAVLFGGKDASGMEGHRVMRLPLKVSAMMSPVWNWHSTYSKYLGSKAPDREDAREAWASATDRLLELIGPEVMQPCLSSLGEGTLDCSLIVAAGRLAGLPIHAARLADGRFVAECVGTVEYIPNVSVLSPKQEKWEQPKTALCVVSDPDADLTSAATECDAIAKILIQSGTKVSVLAVVGRHSGESAFKHRGVVIAPEAEMLGELPTPSRVADLMPNKEHFFYSGHGTRADGQSGLVLAGEDGNVKLFSEDEILSMPALRHRPLIVLSACETAGGGQGSSELFDVASCFLRIGARYVVGSLWVVVEDCATAFTASFYKALNQGAFPNEAFGLAVRDLRSHRATRTTVSKVPPDHPIYWAPFLALRGE